MFPVDQHYLNHPKDLWDGPINDILVDLQSEVILEGERQIHAIQAATDGRIA